jgi:hypothetical protein
MLLLLLWPLQIPLLLLIPEHLSPRLHQLLHHLVRQLPPFG